MDNLPKVYCSRNVALPVLGQGTWNMGDNAAVRAEEMASLQQGIEYGLRVIDTAEMYGNGRSEELVGEAIAGRRDKVFLVSKVLPSHADKKHVMESCKQSLKRLKTDHMDLYLLHWKSATPLAETIEAFELLKEEGLIGHWGVSNFDVADMQEMESIHKHCLCFANQILYNLEQRGVEYDLLPFNVQKEVLTMAYSPLGQARTLLNHPVLKQIAQRHMTSRGEATPAQIALAWVLRQPNVLAIPKAGNRAHLFSNMASLEITLTDKDLLELDRVFPPPRHKMPLGVI